jgi:hypothetical protein
MNMQKPSATIGSRPRKLIPKHQAGGEHPLDATYRLIEEAAAHWRDCGSSRRRLLQHMEAEVGVSYEWLAKLARRVIEDPGIRKVMLVHDWLWEHKHDGPPTQ